MFFTPFRTVLLFTFLIVTCILALPYLRINLVPQQKTKCLTVNYNLLQAGPETVEQLATAPLENVFSQINQLKKIESKSGYNSGRIQLTFDKDADLDMKKFEVASVVRQVYPKLSHSISYPEIRHGQASDEKVNSPLMIYSFVGPSSEYELKKEARELFTKKLSVLPGLREIRISGSESRQISIVYDLGRMQSYRIDKEQIIKALDENKEFYPGVTKTKNESLTFVKVTAGETNIKAIGNLLIKSKEGYVRLNEIAKIYIEEQEPQSYFRINGKNSIAMSLYPHEGENALVVAEQVRSIIQNSKSNLKSGQQVILEYDDSEFLTTELRKNYFRTSLSILILTFFIFLSYRHWKYLVTLLASLTIGVALCILSVWYFEINIHLYTLAGITISFGLMVDNGIVVLDHYHRFRNRKVFLALLGASCTTAAALLMLILLPEEERLNLNDFIAIVVIAIGSSLITSLLFTPEFHKLLFKDDSLDSFRSVELRKKVKHLKTYGKTIAFLSRYKMTILIIAVLLFGIPIFLLPKQWEGHEWYNKTIGSDVYQEKIRPGLDKILGGSLRLFARNAYEKSSFREPGKTKLYVMAELPIGNTLEQMNAVLQKTENYLSSVNGIDKYVTEVYSGQYGSIEITFDERHENSSLPYQLKFTLIARSLDWGGVAWEVYGVGQGFSNGGDSEIPSYRVLMKGYNYDELEKQSDIFARKLLEHKRIQKVNTNERLRFYEKAGMEYALILDPAKLGDNQLSSSSIVSPLQIRSKPLSPAYFLTLNGDILPVYLKENNAENFSVWSMMQSPLEVSENKSLKLSDISQMSLQKTSSAIYKEDRQYLRVIGFDYNGSSQFGDKYLKDKLDEMKKELPLGYSVERQNWNLDPDKLKREYSLLLLLFAANYIICAILFENLKQPLFILATIPVSFIGLFSVFGIFNFDFDQGGYAAFILLGGLAVNASIFIVSDFNHQVVKSPNFNRRLVKTIGNRSRTILLTTTSTCCGLIPFLFDGPKEVFWFSLAIGTIGGLLFSLVAIFIILPILMWKPGNSLNFFAD